MKILEKNEVRIKERYENELIILKCNKQNIINLIKFKIVHHRRFLQKYVLKNIASYLLKYKFQ